MFVVYCVCGVCVCVLACARGCGGRLVKFGVVDHSSMFYATDVRERLPSKCTYICMYVLCMCYIYSTWECCDMHTCTYMCTMMGTLVF